LHLLNDHEIDVKARSDGKSSLPGLTPSVVLPSATSSQFGGIAAFLKPAAKPSDDATVLVLSLWLADSFRPFATLEDPLFREFVYLLNPKFKLPHQETVRTKTSAIALDLKNQV
jgi:hypothetical protein